jgi:hypothetical protein
MSLTKRRYTYVDFTTEKPVPIFAKTTNAIVTAADTQEDYFRVGGDRYFELIQTGADNLLAAGGFTHSADGWQALIDAANGDALQITQGMMAGVATPMKFVTGTDGFFIEVKLSSTTLNTADVVMVGFRELAAYAATVDPATALTDYDHKALYGVMDSAGAVRSFVSIGAGLDTSTIATNTPIVTATKVTWRVEVHKNLTVDFYADDVLDVKCAAANPVVVTAKTLVPTMVFVATATGGAAPTIILETYECGLLDE